MGLATKLLQTRAAIQLSKLPDCLIEARRHTYPIQKRSFRFDPLQHDNMRKPRGGQTLLESTVTSLTAG